jgi:hypothetical protein
VNHWRLTLSVGISGGIIHEQGCRYDNLCHCFSPFLAVDTVSPAGGKTAVPTTHRQMAALDLLLFLDR